MATLINKSSHSSLFVSSPGKARATIPGHGINPGGCQVKTVWGLLNKKAKPAPSRITENRSKRYFKKHFYKTNGLETGSTCSKISCFHSFKNRFSANSRACSFGRPFKAFPAQLGTIYRGSRDPAILDVVQGYHLEFLAPQRQGRIRQPMQFSRAESDKIGSEVATLLEKGALNTVKPVSDQFLSSLFLVPKRDGKSRPVINLKELNVFLQYDHFKMECIHLLRDLPQPHDWLGKIDLKDAYFVVPIWKDHSNTFELSGRAHS